MDAVEKKIAALEGGVGAMLTSSGQAANLMAVLNICPAGFHVVSSSAIYGGTFNLFYKTMKEMGIETTFVPPTATLEELRAAMRPNTRAVFAETLANPSLAIADLEVFAQAAHEQGVPLIVDNTFPTPINCRPIEFGADIVTHSTTKYMDGHAVQVGGVIVDSGNFNWDNGKFPMLTQPDESYHGVVYTQQFGKAAYITKARTHLMRDLGAQAAPHERLPAEPGPGDLGPAHGASLLQRPESGPVPGGRPPAWPGWITPTWRATPTMPWPRSTCPTAPAAWCPSA